MAIMSLGVIGMASIGSASDHQTRNSVSPPAETSPPEEFQQEYSTDGGTMFDVEEDAGEATDAPLPPCVIDGPEDTFCFSTE